jgi:hypothetical protein
LNEIFGDSGENNCNKKNNDPLHIMGNWLSDGTFKLSKYTHKYLFLSLAWLISAFSLLNIEISTLSINESDKEVV